MKKYKDIGIYDFSDYAEEITGDALFKINGGAQIENSIEAQANAKVGDTVTDSNGKISVKEVKGETVSGNSIVPVLQGSSEQFATIMESLVGSAYVWGGNSPEDGGMDCSGSVIYALNQMGNNIPDVTANTLYNEYTVPIQGPVQRGNSRFLLNDDGTSAYHIQTITSSEGARVNATGDNTNTITNPGSIDLLAGPLPQSGVIRTFVFSGDQ